MSNGELMTVPITDTVNGYISFENPAVLGDRKMNDLRLGWEHGVLVEASASTNEGYLRSVLATDEGTTLIGEFGIGINPFIDLVCDDILSDEKINGTVHIALGRAYPESGRTQWKCNFMWAGCKQRFSSTATVTRSRSATARAMRIRMRFSRLWKERSYPQQSMVNPSKSPKQS
jgi:leucyl aminopeptidase (aminopeptidase T)